MTEFVVKRLTHELDPIGASRLIITQDGVILRDIEANEHAPSESAGSPVEQESIREPSKMKIDLDPNSPHLVKDSSLISLPIEIVDLQNYPAWCFTASVPRNVLCLRNESASLVIGCADLQQKRKILKSFGSFQPEECESMFYVNVLPQPRTPKLIFLKNSKASFSRLRGAIWADLEQIKRVERECNGKFASARRDLSNLRNSVEDLYYRSEKNNKILTEIKNTLTILRAHLDESCAEMEKYKEQLMEMSLDVDRIAEGNLTKFSAIMDIKKATSQRTHDVYSLLHYRIFVLVIIAVCSYLVLAAIAEKKDILFQT